MWIPIDSTEPRKYFPSQCPTIFSSDTDGCQQWCKKFQTMSYCWKKKRPCPCKTYFNSPMPCGPHGGFKVDQNPNLLRNEDRHFVHAHAKKYAASKNNLWLLTLGTFFSVLWVVYMVQRQMKNTKERRMSGFLCSVADGCLPVFCALYIIVIQKPFSCPSLPVYMLERRQAPRAKGMFIVAVPGGKHTQGSGWYRWVPLYPNKQRQVKMLGYKKKCKDLG